MKISRKNILEVFDSFGLKQAAKIFHLLVKIDKRFGYFLLLH